MKKFLFLFLSFLPLFAMAQEKGFSLINNTQTLQATLSKNAAQTNSISSDFLQEKQMKMLDGKVLSKGKFYYKKEDKVRIDYQHPYQYLLIMNGGNISVKDDGKTNKINARSSKTMQSVNHLMIDCMKGTVFNNKDFSVKAYESNQQYLLVLAPVDAAMKKMFSDIKVYMNKQNGTVSLLVMKENSGDFTLMKFSNIKTNASISDQLFYIR